VTELYHTLNRGVDRREIFLDDQDRFRFIHDLFEFNDQQPAGLTVRSFDYNMLDLRSPTIGSDDKKAVKKVRELLVEIHAFCIMKNHYHLLLSPLVEDGIVQFMRKVNIGYAKYFNKKYARTGALFEGRYKSVLVENETHFAHLPFYIHLNPLDFSMPEWREWKIDNLAQAQKFLQDYHWSSHLDYLGKKNFPSVTQREFLTKYFDSEGGYAQVFKKRLEGMEKEANIGIGFANLADIALE